MHNTWSHCVTEAVAAELVMTQQANLTKPRPFRALCVWRERSLLNWRGAVFISVKVTLMTDHYRRELKWQKRFCVLCSISNFDLAEGHVFWTNHGDNSCG